MIDKIEKYISNWENKGYENGIPDEAPARLEHLGKVPSYKLICRAILKNDLCLTTLGFSKPKSEVYSNLKKVELEKRANERI